MEARSQNLSEKQMSDYSLGASVKFKEDKESNKLSFKPLFEANWENFQGSMKSDVDTMS